MRKFLIPAEIVSDKPRRPLVRGMAKALSLLLFQQVAGVAWGADPYLQSDGTQGIVSDYYPSPKTKVVVDFELTEVSTTQQRPFGCDSDSASNPLSFSVYLNGGGVFAWAFQDGKGNWTKFNDKATPAANVRYVITLDGPGKVASVRGTGMAYDCAISTTRTKTSKNPMGIFSDYENNGFVRTKAKMKLYSLQCYDDGVLVRDFRPYLLDGVPGLRDAQSGKFFTSSAQSSGSALKPFAYGGDIESGESGDAYIENPDSQWLQTDYYPCGESRIDVDFKFGEIGAQYRAVGAVSGAFTAYAYINGSKVFSSALCDSGTNYCSTGINADTMRHRYVLDGPNNRDSLITAGCTNHVFSLAKITHTARATLPLLVFRNNGGFGQSRQTRLYGLKIWEGDVLVRDYVPCVSGGVTGLLDRVNLKFISTTDSRKPLSGGGDIMVADDAYLEADGTQAIISDYYPSPKSKVVADFAFTAVSPVQQRVFGCSSDSLANPLSFAVYLNGSQRLAWAFQDGDGNWGSFETLTNSVGIRINMTLDGPGNAINLIGGFFGGASRIATTRTRTSSNPMGIFCDIENGKIWKEKAHLKLYSLRCYDDGELVREYLPCRAGDVCGLFETVTRTLATNFVKNANAFRIGGAGSDFGGVRIFVAPEDMRPNRAGTKCLTAFAPGAVTYRWYSDGVEMPGETGWKYAVPWKGSGFEQISVKPVYEVGGGVIEGAAVSCVVDHNLPGFMLLVE